MGVATTCAPYGWGLQTPSKKVDLLGQPLFRNHAFEIFRSEPPLSERMADKGISCPLASPEKEVRGGEYLSFPTPQKERYKYFSICEILADTFLKLRPMGSITLRLYR